MGMKAEKPNSNKIETIQLNIAIKIKSLKDFNLNPFKPKNKKAINFQALVNAFLLPCN